MQPNEATGAAGSNEERLQRFVASILDGAVEGIITMGADGRIQSANPAAERIFGYEPGEMIGLDVAVLMPAPYRDEHQRYLDHYQRTGQRRMIGVGREVQGLQKNGTVFPMDLSVNEVRWDHQRAFVGIVRDISEKRAMQEALRRERDLAESLIETAPAIVLVLDLEGRIIRFNHFFANIAGRRLEEVQGTDWFETFLPPEERPAVREVFRRVVADEQRTARAINTVIGGGRRHLIEWHSTLLRDGSEVIGVLSIGLDIPERRRVEEQLTHAQKMEAVGRLAGGIAHDFNNLLMGVIGCCRMATRHLEEGHPARALIEEISSSAERSVGLTRQLLAFSRKAPAANRPIDLDDVVARIGTIAGPLVGENIHIDLRRLAGSAPILGDPTQLEQVLMNLIVNARDAMPNGGRLLVATDECRIDGKDSRFGPLSPGRYVTLTVSDTGVGMEPAVQKRIFEPFFTTKPPGAGTGLGLPTVFGIVTRLGGGIAVESEPGKGSTFTIALPRSEQQPTRAVAPTAVEPADRRGRGETLLLVEDEPLVRSTVQNALQELGYRVLVAKDAQEALRLLAHRRVQLLLTDVVLPDLSGPDLARRIRTAQPDLRVLFMSAHSHEYLVDAGKLTPDETSLEKPFTDAELAVRVRATLDAGPPRRQAGAFEAGGG